MNADIKGALAQINKSWKSFYHNGKPMSKNQVLRCLKYGERMGYKHTGEIPDSEIDRIIRETKY